MALRVRLLSTAAAVIIVSGCISHTRYPASWPDAVVADSEACTPLSGSFNNVGAWAASGEMDQRLLAALFFPLGINEPGNRYEERRAASHVSFDSREDGSVDVRAWAGEELLFERLLADPDLDCEEGRLEFRQTEWQLSGSIGTVVRVRSRYLIALASDGSLVMEQRELGAGVAFMIVPVAGKKSSWLRFEAHVESGAGEAIRSDGLGASSP